jgi:SAM-dependent methyltransferase
MSFISSRVGQFQYFDLVLGRPEWRGRKVLDFGGNVGNLLRCGSTIDVDRYWCIDVSRDAIAQGRRTYPAAHWLFYDRYNFAFNPTGVRGLAIPDPGERFDVIVAYSVFTHTNRAEMRELVGQLQRLLAPGGTIALTFIDPDYRHAASREDLAAGHYDGTNLQWRLAKMGRLNPDLDLEWLARRSVGAGWITLVNDRFIYVDDEEAEAEGHEERTGYLTLCRPELMQALFPDAAVLPPPRDAYRPPIAWEMQHCCRLGAGAAGID